MTEAELEARLEEVRDELLAQDEHAVVVHDMEESAKEALLEALPGITEDVGQKMGADGRDDADAIGGPSGAVGRPPTSRLVGP